MREEKENDTIACCAGTFLSFRQNTKDKNERSSNIGQPSAGKQHYGHAEIFHIKGRDQGRRAACGSSLWSRFSCTLCGEKQTPERQTRAYHKECDAHEFIFYAYAVR
jgi:hypothetical protein